jgi:hypothetical protein
MTWQRGSVPAAYPSPGRQWPQVEPRALTPAPELQSQRDFHLQLDDELKSAGLMTASLSGMVSPTALMDRRTSRPGRQVVRLISRPGDDSN